MMVEVEDVNAMLSYLFCALQYNIREVYAEE